MEVVNEVMPTSQARIDEMMQPGPDGPIYMVNLLKFKDKAEYEDGRETDLTGFRGLSAVRAGSFEAHRRVRRRSPVRGESDLPVARTGGRNCGTRLQSPSIRTGRRCWQCHRRLSGKKPQCTAQQGWPVSSTSRRPHCSSGSEHEAIVDASYLFIAHA